MKKTALLAASVLLSMTAIAAIPQSGYDNDSALSFEEFRTPAKDFRPRVWWHWMNGNITKDGILKDLSWMDRAGIAGFHNFDAGLSTPQIVKDRLIYMTPEWKDAFNYALDIADSLDMEVTIASSPGWSITGGPWVSLEDGEKKIVWREMEIEGGRSFKGALPEPYINSGQYQDICGYPAEPHKFEFYKDLFVLAVKMSDAEASAADIRYDISTSDQGADGSILCDGKLNSSEEIKPDGSGKAWIQFGFDGPQAIRSMTFIQTSRIPVELLCSDDGEEFRTVMSDIPMSKGDIVNMTMIDIPRTEAKYFRIAAKDAGECLAVNEAKLDPFSVVNMSQEKTGLFVTYTVSDNYPTPDDADAVQPEDIIDITAHCKDGMLEWKVPEGRWKIFRFGYNLLGRRNGPASPEATGLEVDKLDADAVRRYYDNYLGMYQEASGGRLGTAINCLMIDSYESGRGTWAVNMEQEFQRRRGYKLRPWFPALAGMVIGSAEETEQFLFDWRTTLGELIAENHYDIVNGMLERYGMTRYTESHEERRAFVGDGMMVKRKADIPMSAIWARYRAGWHSSYPTAEADVRESASVAHIYGQNICAAESFTTNGRIGKEDGFGAYQCCPANLKPLADAAMACGLNRFVVHCSVHQPCDDKVPGLGLGTYGQWFNRHDTWAEEASSWTDYLSRSCYALQQGRWVADIAYFYGEDKNVTQRFFDERIVIPSGYNFDFVNADIILNVFKLDGDALVTDSGMRYRMLVLDDQLKYISFPVLKRILKFAKAGVLISGDKPVAKAGRAGSSRRFEKIVSRIWDAGRPNVFTGRPLEEYLMAGGVSRDADFSSEGDADIRFVHRSLEDGELYWIANITPEYRDFTVSLRTDGKKPEIWHADSATRSEVSYRMEGGRTLVDLKMVPDDAQFILLREDTDVRSAEIPAECEKDLGTVDGPWNVSFQQGRGAPESIRMKELRPLSESAVEGIRYFSGTATYSQSFTFEKQDAGRIVLDLGEVHHMARVFLNGEDLGLAWKEPYRVDASTAIREGENTLEIRVTDSWANRLIGDERLKPEDRLTFTAVQFYTAEDEPVPSGLVGPVRLLSICD